MGGTSFRLFSRCYDGELAQVQVDGDDFSGERHDGARGGGERADDFAETVAYGHVCRCDEVVFRPQLEKVAGFDYDDILRNFEVSVFGGTLGNGILVRPAFGAAPDGGENACTSQDSDIRLLHYLPFFS